MNFGGHFAGFPETLYGFPPRKPPRGCFQRLLGAKTQAICKAPHNTIAQFLHGPRICSWMTSKTDFSEVSRMLRMTFSPVFFFRVFPTVVLFLAQPDDQTGTVGESFLSLADGSQQNKRCILLFFRHGLVIQRLVDLRRRYAPIGFHSANAAKKAQSNIVRRIPLNVKAVSSCYAQYFICAGRISLNLVKSLRSTNYPLLHSRS